MQGGGEIYVDEPWAWITWHIIAMIAFFGCVYEGGCD